MRVDSRVKFYVGNESEKDQLKNPGDFFRAEDTGNIFVVGKDGSVGSVGGGASVEKPYSSIIMKYSGEWIETTSGTLEIGKTYLTQGLEAGDDFSNVGWVADETYFVATGTTPNNWTNGTYVFNYTDSQPTFEIVQNDFDGVNFTYTQDYNDGNKFVADSPIFTNGLTAFPVNSTGNNPSRLNDTTLEINTYDNADGAVIEIRVYD